jgi:hypothetical protein
MVRGHDTQASGGWSMLDGDAIMLGTNGLSAAEPLTI